MDKRDLRKKRLSFFDYCPIHNMSIAKECEQSFISTYNDRIRYAVICINGGHKVFQVIKINCIDHSGKIIKTNFHKIILN